MKTTVDGSRGRLLQRADALIHGERREQYGPPSKNFADVARMWSAYLTTKLGQPVELEASDVAFLMVNLKMARYLHRKDDDSLLDCVGYLGCIEDVLDQASKSV